MLDWMGMEPKMAVSPERTAELMALSEERPRPKLVCVNGKVVGDAVVIVSEKDPNWWRGMAVRRNGEIRVSPEHGVGRRL